MRFLKTAIAIGAAALALGSTAMVTSAYPPPKDHHGVDCDPGRMSNVNAHCHIVFSDYYVHGEKNRTGDTVCFSHTGPGTITPTCSTTNSRGQAVANYSAGAHVTCPTTGPRPYTLQVYITGTEQPTATDGGGSTTTEITLVCPRPHKDHKDGDGDTDGDNGDKGHSTTSGGGTDSHDVSTAADSVGTDSSSVGTSQGTSGTSQGTSGTSQGTSGTSQGTSGTSHSAGGSSHSAGGSSSGTSGHSDGSTAGTRSISGRNAVAFVATPAVDPAGVALGVGILGLIVILSVAITGRLRLRRLRG